MIKGEKTLGEKITNQFLHLLDQNDAIFDFEIEIPTKACAKKVAKN